MQTALHSASIVGEACFEGTRRAVYNAPDFFEEKKSIPSARISKVCLPLSIFLPVPRSARQQETRGLPRRCLLLFTI